MKIVFLATAGYAGGTEAALLEFMGAVRDSRPDWSLHLIAGEDGPLLRQVRELGATSEVLVFPEALRLAGEERFDADRRAWHGLVHGVRLARAARHVFGYAGRLRARFQEWQPNIVHSHSMKMHLLAALSRRGRSKIDPPLIWHLHDYLSARPTLTPLLRRLAKNCRVVIANSNSVAADARQFLPDTLPITTIYNVVNPENFRPEGSILDLDKLADRPSPAPGTLRVGLVATFARWKGHETFLRAISLFPPDRKVHFYIIGGPVYATRGSQWDLEELKKSAEDLRVSNRVSFSGFVEDAAAAFRALDIVVHASTEKEPFGLAIIEAMACGRPVISSALGGAAELISPQVDGLIFRAGDPQALAAAIDRLVKDPELRQRLGQAGRIKAKRDFTRELMAQRLVPLYEKLVSA